MCKNANKHLLVSGCGLELLSYFCATAFIDMNIANGKGEGGRIQHFNDYIPFEEDAILDNETGDYYQYSPVSALKDEGIGGTGVGAEGECGVALENGSGDEPGPREVRGEAEDLQSAKGARFGCGA
jgi:hypothetical protein